MRLLSGIVAFLLARDATVSAFSPRSFINKVRVKRQLKKVENLTETTRDYLLELDPFTVKTVLGGPPRFIKANEKPWKPENVTSKDATLGWEKSGGEWKKNKKWNKKVGLITYKVGPKGSKRTVLIKDEDQYFGPKTVVDYIKGLVLKYTPMQTLRVPIDNEGAEIICEDLKITEGEALPISYDTDFNMLTDESFSRIFFNGICSPLVADLKGDEDKDFRELGPYVVDIPLQNLDVRKGFLKYGVRVHFNDNQEATAIYDYNKNKFFKPGDGDEWDQAKFFAKVNGFLFVTAREHLIWTHVILSNSMTREMTIELPPDHPIRRLLTIHTFRTTRVNLNAFASLLPRNSLLHRSSGLTYSSLQEVFEIAFETCKVFEPFPDREVCDKVQKLSKDGKFPYLNEGKEFYEIVREYVTEWLSEAGDEAALDDKAMTFYKGMREESKGLAYEVPEYKSRDDMITLLTTLIWTVTCYHELVGCVVDYQLKPDRAGFRAIEGRTSVDLQSFLYTSIIGASTSIRMPELNKPFKNFFGVGDLGPDWEKTVWNKFTEKMTSQSAAVNRANAKRAVEFNYFDPNRFESSVSV